MKICDNWLYRFQVYCYYTALMVEHIWHIDATVSEL